MPTPGGGKPWYVRPVAFLVSKGQWACVVVVLAASSVGCLSGVSVPDPKAAAKAWADAAAAGDADTLHGMLTKRSQAELPKAEVARIVKESPGELKDQAAQIKKKSESITTVAILQYEDGTSVALELENGVFRIASAGYLPAGGATPEQTALAFRDVLKRRSYPGILRLLSPALRAAVEGQLKGLETALDQPDATKMQNPSANGDEVEIKLQNGHRLRLKRIDGKWYIDNFE